MSATDDDYDPYAGLNIDLCLEVDAINLNTSNLKKQMMIMIHMKYLCD